MTLIRQHLIFCTLGPIIAQIAIVAGAVLIASLQIGFGDAASPHAGAILLRLTSPTLLLLYPVSVGPAFVASWCYSKMEVARRGHRVWAWFAASLVAMAVGPALLAVLIAFSPMATLAGAALSSLLAVTVCAMLSPLRTSGRTSGRPARRS